MPPAGIEPTSPCILVRSANHYTIREHHAGNVAVWLVKIVYAWRFLGPYLLDTFSHLDGNQSKLQLSVQVKALHVIIF